eukprot:m51a1_g12616 hypothetical protein (177) ;mRNA; f:417-2898
MLPKSAKPFLHTFNISGSSKGWMNHKVFLSWVTESFIPKIHRCRVENGTPDAPALLLSDNHNSRANSAALRALQKAHIDVQMLPAHTFHILQPLDQEVNLIYKKVLGLLVPAQQQDQIKGLKAARAKLKDKITMYKKEQLRVFNDLHEQHTLIVTLKSQNEGLKKQLELLKSEHAN